MCGQFYLDSYHFTLPSLYEHWFPRTSSQLFRIGEDASPIHDLGRDEILLQQPVTDFAKVPIVRMDTFALKLEGYSSFIIEQTSAQVQIRLHSFCQSQPRGPTSGSNSGESA